MKINGDRLKKNILRIGNVGKGSTGGITRLAFSKEYFEALNELKVLMEEQGLKTKIDKVGNLIGRREGSKDLPCIMIGSHLDTVKNGGLLDGNLGVISALESIMVLNENHVETNHPIEIVAFNAEEGSEMGGTFGSRVMIGRQDLNESGFSDQLSTYGLTLKDVEESTRNSEEIKAFLELHIEQGGVLDTKNLPIGVVNGIVGITRYKIIVKGEANHAGTTPMNLRKDALTMASKLILEIDSISNSMDAPFVSTVGYITAYPGSYNVIPGEVEFVLELRDLDRQNISTVVDKIKKYTESIKDYEFEFESLIDKSSVKTDQNIRKIIEDICIENNIDYEVLASGAGHDALEMANKVPTSMIFIASKDGKSHCPEEYSDWEDINLGAQVLLESLLKVDKSI